MQSGIGNNWAIRNSAIPNALTSYQSIAVHRSLALNCAISEKEISFRLSRCNGYQGLSPCGNWPSSGGRWWSRTLNVKGTEKRSTLDTHRSLYNIHGPHLAVTTVADTWWRAVEERAPGGSEPTELTAVHNDGRQVKILNSDCSSLAIHRHVSAQAPTAAPGPSNALALSYSIYHVRDAALRENQTFVV